MNSSVLVIGAGPAGLYAASELSAAGYDCLVLEARDRVGGRIHTVSGGDGRLLEAGAEFIHGKLSITLALMEDAGLKKTEASGRWVSLRGGHDSVGGIGGNDWQAMLKKMRRLSADCSLQEFLQTNYAGDEHAALKDRAVSFAEGFDSADASRASARALGEEWSSEEGENYRVNGGYGSLMDFLAQRCVVAGARLELSQPVDCITASENGVMVSVGDQSFRAQNAIVAMPLGVLQHGAETLLPDSPAYTEALRLLGMGNVIKFVFRFSEAFWEDEYPDLGFLLGAAEVPTWWTQAPERIPVLTGWMAGRSAHAHSHQSDEMLKEAALKSLAQLFSRDLYTLDVLLMEAHVFNWSNDPYARGSYAYATVDSKAALSILAQPFKGRVFFAGEYMYEGPAMGTVEAALWSGREAAQQLMALDRQTGVN